MYSYRPGGVFEPAQASPAELYTRIYGSGFRDLNAAEFTPDPQVGEVDVPAGRACGPGAW
jgi:hypothetical protein